MRHSRRSFLSLAVLAASALPVALQALAAPTAPQTPRATPPSLLLIASRKLTHPVFRETVILLTRQADGPIGIIVNRPLGIPLDLILPSLPGAEKHMLYRGGPVELEAISYLFRSSEPVTAAVQVAEKTYLGRSPTLLNELLRETRAHTGLRITSGYAGWAPLQLENEIARGDWHALPVDTAALFDRPEAQMWPELHRRATQLSARFDGMDILKILRT